MKVIFGLLILSMFSLGCSSDSTKKVRSSVPALTEQKIIKKSAPTEDQETHDDGHGHDPVYTGVIDEQMAEFFISPRVSLSQTCDIDLKDIKIEIGKELDKKKSELMEFERVSKRNVLAADEDEEDLDEYAVLTFGDIEFEDNIDRTKQPENKWKEISLYSWHDIVNFYKKIKGTPISNDWVKLDKVVRRIIKSDRQRILHAQNLSLRVQDQEPLKRLIREVESCANNPECTKLELSTELSSWAGMKAYYPNTLELLKTEINDDFRELLESFLEDLKQDYNDRYQIAKINHIIDPVTSEITVHLDLSVFGLDARKMASYIEDYWSKGGLKIKVLTEKNEKYSYFKFVSSPLEERASVNYDKMELRFAPNMSIKRVMHEFGHILGLNDQYFTIWDEKTCSYSEQYNDFNLMSSSDRGHILKNHIQDLREIYFPGEP